MKNTTNVFLKGMTSDMHPLTTSQLEYTDALNATLITFNGNEQMMQNDMGNTLIQDSKTGNIMGLREGFIPVGLKEHGGIMYVASVNKDGVGEIGTIPSPVIRYNKQKDYKNEKSETLEATPSSPSKFYKLTSEKVLTGEKFASILLLDDDELFKNVQYATESNIETISYPIYSSKDKKGLYNIKLYAQTDDQIFNMNDQVELNSDEPYTYSVTDPTKIDNTKKYWFANVRNRYIANSVDFDVDTMLVYENSDNKKINPFVHYPNIPAGYPSIRFETENINSFSLSVNKAQNQVYPLTRCDITDSGLLNYMAIFPYFIYNTDSAVHIDKIVVSVTDFKGNEKTLCRVSKNGENEKSNILEFNYDDDSAKRNLQRYKIEDETFALIKDITTSGRTDFNSIVDATDSKFKTDSSKALFTMEIGENLDQWFILNVKYYSNEWENEPVGEYNLRFNQYIMDVKHEFITLKLEPEENTEGIDYRIQLYDKEKYPDEDIQFPSDAEKPVTGISLIYDIQAASGLYLTVSGDFSNFKCSSYNAHEYPMIYLYGNEIKRNVWVSTDTSDLDFGKMLNFNFNLSGLSEFTKAFNHFYGYCNANFNDPSNEYAKCGDKQGTISVSLTCKIITEDGKEQELLAPVDFAQSFVFHGNASSEQNKGVRETTGSNRDLGEIHVSGSSPKSVNISFNFGKILKSCINNLLIIIDVNLYDESMINIKDFKIKLNNISLTGSMMVDPLVSGEAYEMASFGKNDDNSLLLFENDQQIGYVTCTSTSYTGTINNINAEYKFYYLPQSGDFKNKGNYKIIPLYNLFGLNKSALSSDYTRYGIMSENENIHLVLSNIIIEENYLPDILLDNNIFVSDTTEMNKSSLLPSISIKKLASTNYDTNVSIPSGIYYLGSVIRSKDSNSENCILLTFLDQLTNESVTAKLYPVGDEDNFPTRSKKEGGLIYFPNGGVLNNIKFIGSEPESENIIIQDLGLYELNLDFNSEPNKNVSDFLSEHDKISYAPNGSELDNIGYCYATPQLCWTFIEDSYNYLDNCVLMEYDTINCGMHAYQTKFGEYYTKVTKNDETSQYEIHTKNIIDLPDNNTANIDYRIPNELS